ncbi:right-handed parallel beta-helix repeat-containing protein [Streptomyces bullii]|uniref:Right-handed parallel beta-helix repeat-containing protein n=1 Tax=Streptomyces bullii TaxID=349910 RepID=A0ABW0ULC3_9ACTN
MPLYTFGGTPSDVLTDDQGNVIPDYPLVVRAAGTGAEVTALFEADGTTPIAQLRSNPSSSPAPGAIRTFKAADVSEIEYEYLGPGGTPLRWYQVGREVASGARDAAAQALAEANTKLDAQTTDPQTVAGPVDFSSPISAPNLGDQSAARWFVVTGATGDGVADDRAAIQAQLNAARDAGGGIVFLPPGKTYGISTFLVVYSDTTIWAYGATLKAIGNSGILRNFQSTDLFAGYTGRSRIRVLGGTWDGNAADAGVGTVTAETNIMNFVHCQDITVRDAVLMNVSTAHALEFNACDGGRALNCRFLGFKDNSSGGTRGFSEAVQVDMSKSGSSSIGDFDNTPARNILVEGCYFGPSTRLGAFGRAVGSHTLAAGVTYDNIQVLDNRIDGTLQEGIHPYGWKRAVISRNVITGTGKSGILATLTDPATTSVAPYGMDVSDNIIDGCGDDSGIRVISYAAYKYPGVNITGNVIRSVTGNGIHAEHCQAPNITGNRVESTTSTGIYAHYSDGTTLAGNTARAVGSNGLNVSGTAGASITGNVVDGTSSNFGIFVGQGSDGSTNSTDTVVVGNQITAPASSGIRLSTNATGCLVTGNKVRKGTGAATSALSMAASATSCSVLDNDFSGNGWNASAAMSVSTAAPVTGPGGMTALPGSNAVDGDLTPVPALEAAMSPAGRYETTSRLRCGTASTPVSGALYLVPIWLPKGLVISSISFTSGGTAAASPTNQWFTLHNSSRVALARTADATTAAWASNTTKTLAIAQTTAGSATSYTTTYSGLHYLGFMVAATTVPNIVGEGSLPAGLANTSPGFGPTNSGQTTPPTVTGGAFTAAAFAGAGILAHGYVA